ncbi:MAG: 4-(cytidine 5'-diphospho)-2-C-methyl-D-erythritol kinase [Clostridia bacterium]|nr:4-(cytidine 5'-diphospho)-2-C-methyl-D-erythritol kinase [Clostridia bacterium]
MKDTLILNANAKINITLQVGGVREDGYHSLRSIMAPITLCDTVTLTKSDDLSCKCSRPLPTESDNIAYKAAKLFFETTGINGGVDIFIKKTIPVSAGMGGGSTDAAATLKGLNEMYDAGLSENELCEIGVKLGADVPFCIYNRPCFAEGIGEILTPIRIYRPLPLVVTIGSEGASTKLMYQIIDSIENREDWSHTDALHYLNIGNIRRAARSMRNDFELCYDNESGVAESRRLLLESGAIAAMMSGSGSSVFGVYNNMYLAKRAVETIRKNNRFAWHCTTT